jgi:hypothetical protein
MNDNTEVIAQAAVISELRDQLAIALARIEQLESELEARRCVEAEAQMARTLARSPRPKRRPLNKKPLRPRTDQQWSDVMRKSAERPVPCSGPSGRDRMPDVPPRRSPTPAKYDTRKPLHRKGFGRVKTPRRMTEALCCPVEPLK